MGWDLAINLAASFIAFLAGWFFRTSVKRRRELRPASRVWKLNPSLPTSIVTGDGPVIDVTDYMTQTVWPAEYAAATEVSLYLARVFGCRMDRICTAERFPKDKALEGNLIVIGGPVRNEVFRALAERIRLPYSFSGFDLIRADDKHTFSARISNGKVDRDIGLVVLAQNPFNQKARLVMLAGCRVFGSLAAARSVVDPLIEETCARLTGGDSACLVVEVDVIDQYIARPRVVDCIPLSRSLHMERLDPPGSGDALPL
ncbi:hypothetical protein [Nonomuraea sp. NPDC049141]|uniref:hypothetical protein n=1 Tax=unclassified Nonomuraea TaxID=2593643 RepID=UPI0033D1AB43